MKNITLLSALLAWSLLSAAQNPLVGTWELVSGKFTDTAGVAMTFDNSSVREIKIITPTHYMFIAQRVVADSLVFENAIAGSIKVTGTKFVETPIHASNRDDLKIKTDFTWKVVADKFTQSGTVTLPNGKQLKFQELVYQRVKAPTAYPKNAALGTWEQLSSGFTFENGLKDYHTRQTAVRFRIINPTHFIQINTRDGRFEVAVAGTYSIEGGAMVPVLEVSSFKIDPADQSKNYYDHIIDGDIAFVKGSTISGEGKETFKWDDVFRRIGK